MKLFNTEVPKPLIICLAGLGIAAIISVAFLVAQVGQVDENPQNPTAETKLGGLMNPDKLDIEADTSIPYDERDSYPEGFVDSIHNEVFRKLSTGKFVELNSFLLDQYNKYQTNPHEQGESAGIYIEYARSDLAAIQNVKADNSKTLLRFYRPEYLAAAMVYLPVSAKYHAFQNVDSYVLPPQKTEADIMLRESTVLSEDELAKLLKEVNSLHTTQHTQAKAYDFTAYDYDFTIILLQAEDIRWEAYAIVSNDPLVTDQIPTVKGVEKIQNSIASTGYSIDGMVYITTDNSSGSSNAPFYRRDAD